MILLRNKKAYSQVLYNNERHYENVVKPQLESAFPNFYVIKFAPLVLGEEGPPRRPDLALVHREYKMWVVVEVELEHHSLTHHVMPQVAALVTGSYDRSHAQALAHAHSEIDLGRALMLVEYRPPVIMVLVNSRRVLQNGWDLLVSELRSELTFLEVYRSLEGDTIFSLSGYRPELNPKRLAGAKKSPMMNGLICPGSPDLPVPDDFYMYYDGRPVRWVKVATADSVVLIPKQPVDLTEDRNYEVLVSDDGRLELRKL